MDIDQAFLERESAHCPWEHAKSSGSLLLGAHSFPDGGSSECHVSFQPELWGFPLLLPGHRDVDGAAVSSFCEHLLSTYCVLDAALGGSPPGVAGKSRRA